ncbi:PspC domain-containing protein [Flavobacteriales bacterium]|nr:PspC domain-containing protein [Flavobacteriales bacterium]
MVETRNISLGGILFHVELPAYTKLKNYLSELRQVLAGSEGQEDILLEVEHRLAELFTGFMAGNQYSVVTLVDVDKACAQLGAPSAFKSPEEESGGSDTNSRKETRRQRVFRDPDDRIIGGVATGIAHRFGVDPVVVRALTVVLFFISGPVLILMYAVLWCIIPKARSVSDRVAMKGDPVTVDAIRDTVEDQLHKAKAEFDNPKTLRRLRAGWSHFISDPLPRFLKGLVRTLGWVIVAAAVVLFLALGGMLLSALISGRWNFISVF